VGSWFTVFFFYNALVICLFGVTFISGRKSGKGIFLYEEKSKNKQENPGAADIMLRYTIPPKQQSVISFICSTCLQNYLCQWCYINRSWLFVSMEPRGWFFSNFRECSHNFKAWTFDFFIIKLLLIVNVIKPFLFSKWKLYCVLSEHTGITIVRLDDGT